MHFSESFSSILIFHKAVINLSWEEECFKERINNQQIRGHFLPLAAEMTRLRIYKLWLLHVSKKKLISLVSFLVITHIWECQTSPKVYIDIKTLNLCNFAWRLKTWDFFSPFFFYNGKIKPKITHFSLKIAWKQNTMIYHLIFQGYSGHFSKHVFRSWKKESKSYKVKTKYYLF
jgi:hypothetical protein